MSSSRSYRVVVCLCAGLLAAVICSNALQVPSAVSPGGGVGGIGETGSCPTFSWSAVDGAGSYELAVFAVESDPKEVLAADFEMAGSSPTLRVRIPGRAFTWTPSRESCFEPGGLYAWAVRAQGPEGEGGWSDVQLFRVALAPTAEEVEEALGVLRRFEQAQASGQASEGGSSGRIESVASSAHYSPLELTPASQEKRLASQPISAPSSFSLVLDGDLSLGRYIFKDGGVLLHDDGSNNIALGSNALSNNSGSSNTAIGFQALASNGPVAFNTAVGDRALTANSLGTRNTALGAMALVSNSGGANNTAVGCQALNANLSGSSNVAIGDMALAANQSGTNNTAIGNDALAASSNQSFNTAVGWSALPIVASGGNSTAVGSQALASLTAGSQNIALGQGAGFFLTSGSNNIYIGSLGASNEDSVIRIGTRNTHRRVFFEGILGQGNSLGSTAAEVAIDSDGHLGIVGSSRRLKKNITSLGDKSRGLHDLRPVSFRYRDELARGGDWPLQIGLIAEEVAKVFPQLVVYDSDATPYSVRYSLISVLLVNEVQRQQEEIDSQRNEISRLQKRLRRLEKRSR